MRRSRILSLLQFVVSICLRLCFALFVASVVVAVVVFVCSVFVFRACSSCFFCSLLVLQV